MPAKDVEASPSSDEGQRRSHVVELAWLDDTIGDYAVEGVLDGQRIWGPSVPFVLEEILTRLLGRQYEIKIAINDSGDASDQA